MKSHRICGGFLLSKDNEDEMDKEVIYCPICGKRVAEWDGKSTMNVESNCRKCNKKVVYDIKTGKITIKNKTGRCTSSGIRF